MQKQKRKYADGYDFDRTINGRDYVVRLCSPNGDGGWFGHAKVRLASGLVIEVGTNLYGRKVFKTRKELLTAIEEAVTKHLK